MSSEKVILEIIISGVCVTQICFDCFPDITWHSVLILHHRLCTQNKSILHVVQCNYTYWEVYRYFGLWHSMPDYSPLCEYHHLWQSNEWMASYIEQMLNFKHLLSIFVSFELLLGLFQIWIEKGIGDTSSPLDHTTNLSRSPPPQFFNYTL